MAECHSMITNKMYTDASGAPHQLYMDRPTYFTYHKKGSTYIQGGQLSCEGESHSYGGKLVDQLVIVHKVTITLQTKSIILHHTDNAVYDMLNNIRLTCTPRANGCASTTIGTYLWHGDPKRCPLAMTRNYVNGIDVQTKDGHRFFISDDGSLIRLLIKGTTTLCGSPVYTTNYPNLFAYEIDRDRPHKNPFTRMISPGEASIVTYVKNRDDFLYHHMLSVIEDEINAFLHQACVAANDRTSSIQDQHRDVDLDIFRVMNSTFGLNSGEVTYLFECHQTTVTAYEATKCYRSLPVYLHGATPGMRKKMYLQPLTRRLSTVGLEIPCNRQFIPKFRNQRGTWIYASPLLATAPTPAPPAQAAQDFLEFDRSADFSHDGLYDDATMAKMEHFLEFGQVRQAIDYKFAIESNDFQDDRPLSQDNFFKDPFAQWKFSFVGSIIKFLHDYGTYMSAFVGTYLIFSLVSQFIHFLFRFNALRLVYNSMLTTILGSLCHTSFLAHMHAKDRRDNHAPSTDDDDSNGYVSPRSIRSNSSGRRRHRRRSNRRQQSAPEPRGNYFALQRFSFRPPKQRANEQPEFATTAAPASARPINRRYRPATLSRSPSPPPAYPDLSPMDTGVPHVLANIPDPTLPRDTRHFHEDTMPLPPLPDLPPAPAVPQPSANSDTSPNASFEYTPPGDETPDAVPIAEIDPFQPRPRPRRREEHQQKFVTDMHFDNAFL